jgi:lipocalin
MNVRSTAKWITFASAFALVAFIAPAAQAGITEDAPLAVARTFEVANLEGSYFEVARTGGLTRKLCTDRTAAFAPSPDQHGVMNATFTCAALNARQTVSGFLLPTDARYPGQLSFRWFSPKTTHNDFNVLAAAPDYSWILVGENSRGNAYVYSRTPEIDAGVLRSLIIRLSTDFDYIAPERTMNCTMHNGQALPGCGEILND